MIKLHVSIYRPGGTFTLSKLKMRLVVIILFLVQALTLLSQEKYSVFIDLDNISDDKVEVLIDIPKLTVSEVEFQIPKIVPGTYSISDFGRFISDLKATDSLGKETEVEKIGTNRWKLLGAESVDTIRYWIGDSFDRTEGYDDNFIFEPAGTSFEKQRKVFVLNTFGIIGYVEGQKELPFEVTVKHPQNIYGATSLKRLEAAKDRDKFYAENYHFLADAPIMYCPPDTISKNIAGANVMISVHSPNKKLNSAEVMNSIEDLMIAQSNYLKGELPVDRYVYLIYLMDRPGLSRANGALEHSYSSLYTLPEAYSSTIGRYVRDIAAHEFLHILTPLNIHSEQIHNFNYINPEMSKHLWLYEGVTEYSSMHVQVREGLSTPKNFLSEIKQKITSAEQYPNVSFTEMSENILERQFSPMFANVYQKGALIGMCLDLHLIKFTNGEIDLPELMNVLAESYGPHKPFKDDSLFFEIEKITSPEVLTFFEKYVEGNDYLPIKECLNWAGVNYHGEEEIEVTTLGNIALTPGYNDEIMVSSIEDMNSFGQEMGYEKGDIIMEINDTPLKFKDLNEFLDEIKYEYKAGDKIKMTVLRNVKGNEKKVVLKGTATKIKVFERSRIYFQKNPTEEQLRIRKAWLEGT